MWSASAGATQYYAEFWNASAGTQISDWLDGTSWSVTPPSPGSTYNWHVKARNSAGDSNWSSTWSITVAELACTQFRADYFNNDTLTPPVAFSRCEATLDHEWYAEAPGSWVGADHFSVRWQGSFNFQAGTYRFSVLTDDGMRIWIDDEKVLDEWYVQRSTYQFERAITAGEHRVKVEYYENDGWAAAKVNWENLSSPEVTLLSQP